MRIEEALPALYMTLTRVAAKVSTAVVVGPEAEVERGARGVGARREVKAKNAVVVAANRGQEVRTGRVHAAKAEHLVRLVSGALADPGELRSLWESSRESAQGLHPCLDTATMTAPTLATASLLAVRVTTIATVAGLERDPGAAKSADTRMSCHLIAAVPAREVQTTDLTAIFYCRAASYLRLALVSCRIPCRDSMAL